MKKKKKKGEGAGEIPQKNTCCSCSRPGFNSQRNLIDSQLPITPVPKTLVPSFTFCRHQESTGCIYGHARTHTTSASKCSRLGDPVPLASATALD